MHDNNFQSSMHRKNLTYRLIYILFLESTLGYDPTVPVQIHSESSWDYCSGHGGSWSCNGSFSARSELVGCGYSGNAQTGSPCTSNTLVSQSADEKHYRISRVDAFNHDNGGQGSGQF